MKLKDKVQHALDESRMLIMGIQVLLGFDFQAFGMAGYDKLPPTAKTLKLVSLVLLLVATAIILMPVARHRIVDRGRDTPHLHAFTSRATGLAVLPFAFALGADFFIVGCRASGLPLALGLALATVVIALASWYLVPFLARRGGVGKDKMEETQLEDKIRHVLTEARVVLPGTQALLGFQFAGALQQGFDTLPASSKLLHVGALCFLGASVIFLMLPGAYHRIAERGEISERLHRVSGVCILLAMVTLAIAIAGDTFIVVRKATDSGPIAAIFAGSWLVMSLAIWLGLMLILRAKRDHRRESEGASGSGTGRLKPVFDQG